MSSPIRTPLSGGMLIGGAALAFAGLAVAVMGNKSLGIPMLVAGFAVEVLGAWVHDWQHRRRGEQPHAMWGQGDRNKPAWVRGRRS